MAEFIGDLIGRILIFVCTILIGGALGCLFIYVGWNWGAVPSLLGTCREIGAGTAFCLALLLSTVASIFKLSFRDKES